MDKEGEQIYRAYQALTCMQNLCTTRHTVKGSSSLQRSSPARPILLGPVPQVRENLMNKTFTGVTLVL